MRVVHVLNSAHASHGGPSRTVPALVAALVACGVDASLHVTDRDGRLPDPLAADIVHDHGVWLPSNHAAAQAARKAGIPFVVTPRGMLEPWALAHRQWKKRAAWALYQRRDLLGAALVHATSEAEAAAVRATGVRTPVAVLRNGVVVPADVARTRGPLRRALFLSRIHPKKGLPMLIEAWTAVQPEGWELVIAGHDEAGHRAKVEALVQRVGLAGVVRFLDPVADADKWALYRTADLFVLPTYSENFGLVVAEALAAGVPVLTTTGAPWRVLQDERLGWWVGPTVDALATALSEATSHPARTLEEMGMRGRALVARDYGWAGVATQMKCVYDWLLTGGDLPKCVVTI